MNKLDKSNQKAKFLNNQVRSKSLTSKPSRPFNLEVKVRLPEFVLLCMSQYLTRTMKSLFELNIICVENSYLEVKKTLDSIRSSQFFSVELTSPETNEAFVFTFVYPSESITLTNEFGLYLQSSIVPSTTQKTYNSCKDLESHNEFMVLSLETENKEELILVSLQRLPS